MSINYSYLLLSASPGYKYLTLKRSAKHNGETHLFMQFVLNSVGTVLQPTGGRRVSLHSFDLSR